MFGKGLVMAQVALSIFLVSSAAIFLNYLSRLRNFDLGFHSDHVLLVTLDSTRSGFTPENLAALYQALLPRLEAIPGVHSASISGCTPLQGCGTPGRYIFAEGHVEQAEDRRRVSVTFVSPRYFKTLGIPLLAGRDFTFRDAKRSRVVVINQAMARRYFSGNNPIGKHITVDKNASPGWFGNDQPYEIVGLVGDVKAIEIRDPAYPAMYFNMFQEDQLMNQLELHTTARPESLSETVRRVIGDLLKNVRVSRMTTLARQVGSNIVPERLIAPLAILWRAWHRARRNRNVRAVGLYGRAPDKRDRHSNGARLDR